MRKMFHRVVQNLNVDRINRQLEENAHLWNERPFRTGYSTSPFAMTSDIWVRYRPIEELKTADDYLQPHQAVFYPTWDILTELKPYVVLFQKLAGARELGGILLTKKPPGSAIPPHSDKGSWHAEYMDAKIWLTLSGPDEGCVHTCEDESVVMKPGEAWTFNNLLPHSVSNQSSQDQVTLIVCMRSAGGNFMKLRE